MADRKATNKYYPPEWTPDQFGFLGEMTLGSINTFVGQHPLRDRARKLNQGILIIRFEMPFNIWCEKCNTHIGKGTRFNAEKKQNGNYHSTKIWNFGMKCATCSNRIEVETDPKISDYVVVKGAQRKTETWDTLDTGGAHLIEEDIKEKLDEDPFFKLEHLATDKAKADENIPWLDKLEDSQFQKTFDDYGNNRLIRKHFREERKELKALDKEAESKGLALTLLPISEGDTEEADSFVRTKSLLQKKNEHLKIKAASIFSASGEPKDPVKQKLLEKAMKNGMDMRLFGGGTAKKTSKFGGISTKGSSLSSTMPLLAMKPTPKEK